MIPHITPRDTYWFPADEIKMWMPREDMKAAVPYEKEAPHIVQHRKGWQRVLSTAPYGEIASWIETNCSSKVERYLTWHFFFEDRSEAKAFADKWGGA